VEDKRVTGTLVNAYYVCRRKVWLFAHEISPFKDNPFLEIGRLIAESSYSREKKEIIIENMKLDILQKGEEQLIVGEIKKSSIGLKPAQMQLAFYLYNLKRQGITVEGELLIPKEKKRIKVKLDDELEEELKGAIKEIKKILKKELPPPPTQNKYCRNCAYREFCYA
jgi:CRISPR-associated exonuclease Cas4